MSGKSVPSPNYTQTPNVFYDEIMPYISSTAELKVTLAVVRQTFGYHKREDQLSLSRLEALTGLSRKSVAEGVKLALERGYVGRRKQGDTYVYGLRVASSEASEESTPPPRSAGEESTPPASEESTPTKENPTKQTNSPKGEDGRPSAGTFVAYLREELDGADVPLLRNREDRYAGEFNKLIKKGVGADVLYKAADRINERWRGDDHKKLLVEQAVEDVVNGKPPAHTRQSSGRADYDPAKARAERVADRARQMEEVFGRRTA